MDIFEKQLQLFDRNTPPLPPGDFIKEEMDKRGWGQVDLANILGRPLPTVNQLIQGKKGITPETAFDLARAFNTTPDFWMAREAAYRLALVENTTDTISERARIYEFAPIKEMERRNWIRKVESLPEIEAELCRFFEVQSLGATPRLAVNARAANSVQGVNQVQLAWCYRALKLAKTVDAKTYDPTKIPLLKRNLRNLSSVARGVEDVPRVLSEFGIRLVVVEALHHSKIDGAAFWIDPQKPVIVLSMRYDRIDYFWFTLMHELIHVEHKDAAPIDTDIEESGVLSPIEERANREGVNALVDTTELASFIRRVSPSFSRPGIIQFANRIKSHPGIVVGQLHYKKALNYNSGRALLIKVRDHLCLTALTDGFGFNLPIIN